jgi:hypothetical protein
MTPKNEEGPRPEPGAFALLKVYLSKVILIKSD